MMPEDGKGTSYGGHTQVVQKQEKGEGKAEESKCQQEVEKVFLVPNLVISDRGTDVRFVLFSTNYWN